MSVEVKRRIGRCQVCGERHRSFDNCPNPLEPRIRATIKRDSDFEATIHARKSPPAGEG